MRHENVKSVERSCTIMAGSTLLKVDTLCVLAIGLSQVLKVRCIPVSQTFLKQHTNLLMTGKMTVYVTCSKCGRHWELSGGMKPEQMATYVCPTCKRHWSVTFGLKGDRKC